MDGALDTALLGKRVKAQLPVVSDEEADAVQDPHIEHCRVETSTVPGRYALIFEHAGEEHTVLATPEVLRIMMARAEDETAAVQPHASTLVQSWCKCFSPNGATVEPIDPGQSLCSFGTVRLAQLQLACDGSSLAGQIWSAGLALARKFQSEGLKLPHASSRVIVELGSGTAIAGLAAALAASCLVVLTDRPDVVPRLQHSIAMNEPLLTQAGASAVAASLEWGDLAAADELLDAHCPDGPDLLIAADCMYQPQPEAQAALRSSMAALARRRARRRPPGASPTLIWHAYEKRWEEVTSRWRRGLRASASELRLVHESSLDASPPVHGRQLSGRQLVLEVLQLVDGE